MPETPNHGYNVPNEGDQDWHQPLNENFEQFDADVEVRDTDINRGNYDPQVGAKFLATDTGAVYVGDGTAWQPVESTGPTPTLDTITPAGGFLGVGRSSPLTDAEYVGITAPAAGSGFGGTYIDVDDPGGMPFYGYAADGTTGPYHYFDASSGKWKLNNGGTHLTVQGDGNVGVGTEAPDWPLDVETGDQYAIWGESTKSDPDAAGVYGKNASGAGVVAVGRDKGIRAVATDQTGVAVEAVNRTGRALVTDGHATIDGNCRVNQDLVAATDARVAGELRVNGNLVVDGGKNFAQAVETPAGEREVTYTSVEAPDARTEVSGVARLADGRAEVDLPEHFAWVTDADEPIVAQVTPHAGAPVQPQVTERSPERIVVEDVGDGPDDYEVSYTVKGTRDGFADEPVVRELDDGGRNGPAPEEPETAGGRAVGAPGDTTNSPADD